MCLLLIFCQLFLDLFFKLILSTLNPSKPLPRDRTAGERPQHFRRTCDSGPLHSLTNSQAKIIRFSPKREDLLVFLHLKFV